MSPMGLPGRRGSYVKFEDSVRMTDLEVYFKEEEHQAAA